MADFTDALEKVVLGTPRKIMLTEEERQRTAHHEGGHALLGMLTPGADPVRKVSITPRGHALGVTFQSPEADQYAYSEDYLRGRIVGALGGRAAEEVVYGDDLDRGRVRPGPGQPDRPADGRPLGHVPEGRPDRGAAGRGDRAAVPRRLRTGRPRRPGSWSTTRSAGSSTSATCGRVEVLRDNRDRLERLAEALLRHETLDADAAYEAAGVPRTARPDFRPDRPDGGPGAGAAGRPGAAASLSRAVQRRPGPGAAGPGRPRSAGPGGLVWVAER